MYDIPLIKTYIDDDIKRAVAEVIESGYWTEGPITREFENMFREYVGCRHAIAVTSCTTGLELALRAVGVGAGDEVIIPDYTYPATADAVAIVGANIVVVDASPETMLIDYQRIEDAITPRTKAIIPVSIFGNPLDYDMLKRIKGKYDLFLIEDAACSVGATYDDEHVGNIADISVFSFHPRKFISTGEGGMITTNRDDWAEWMTSYKHFGMGVAKGRLDTEFVRWGTNYKMSNINAAVGLAQMKKIDFLLERRQSLAANYLKLLAGRAEIRLPQTTPGGSHSVQSFCVFVANRDRVMAAMRTAGIEVQIGTYALHRQSIFKNSECCRLVGDMAGSSYAFENCMALPLYHEMSEMDQVRVIETLSNVIRNGKN